MKTQTLKTLITQACDDISERNYGLTPNAVAEMRDRIFMLIDLYEEDNKSHINPYYGSTLGVPNGSISSTSENYCTNLGGEK